MVRHLTEINKTETVLQEKEMGPLQNMRVEFPKLNRSTRKETEPWPGCSSATWRVPGEAWATFLPRACLWRFSLKRNLGFTYFGKADQALLVSESLGRCCL